MNPTRLCIALTASTLLLSGCASFKERVAVLDKKIEGWGPPGSGVVGSRLADVINILVSYEATPKQIAQAQERAEAYVAKVTEEAPTPDTPPKDPSDQPAEELVRAPTPEEVADDPESGLIAIVVDPDERSKGKKSVMLWHTRSGKLVGNKVYDIETVPKVGQQVQLREPADTGSDTKFRTYSARFVGTGTPPA